MVEEGDKLRKADRVSSESGGCVGNTVPMHGLTARQSCGSYSYLKNFQLSQRGPQVVIYYECIISADTTMSFGYSVGDFIAGANLTYQLIRVLSETNSACLACQEAMMELGAMQQAFLQVSQLKYSDMLSMATTNSASYIVMSAMDIITNFLERTKQYRKKLRNSDSATGIGGSWCKIGLLLFKEEIRSD